MSVDWGPPLGSAVVPQRPKVADCWGVLINGKFWYWFAEDSARYWFAEDSARMRAIAMPTAPLARIVNGRVCDEHGVPFEAES